MDAARSKKPVSHRVPRIRTQSWTGWTSGEDELDELDELLEEIAEKQARRRRPPAPAPQARPPSPVPATLAKLDTVRRSTRPIGQFRSSRIARGELLSSGVELNEYPDAAAAAATTAADAAAAAASSGESQLSAAST
eukprot:79881-Prymnesium_polylepis.1